MEYYPRKIEEKLEYWLNRKEVIIIKGPRQSGKTTLLLHLKEKYDGEYITLEDDILLKSLEENPKEFVKRYLDKKILSIDEAQYCKKIGKIVKLIFDVFSDKIKIVTTGSGSFDIKVEIGKYLVGRCVYFELFPLDFEEFLLWKAKDLYKIFIDLKNSVKEFILSGKNIENPIFEKEFKSLLNEYLIFGGFPAIVKERDEKIKIELLKNLVRTYLEKDVFFFFNIYHLEKFRNLLNFLSFNIGSIIEFSSISKDLKIDYKTIEKYISILTNTYIISLISPFYKNLSTELKKSKKVYFIDLGIRNSLLNNFLPIDNRTDKGQMLENFVFNELRSNFEGKINYWRTTNKNEVDFVLQVNDKIVPIEVKTSPNLKGGFVKFIKTYKPECAIVFNGNEFSIKKINNTKIAFIPFYYI
jgi:predicted AAA+ superfamily ATPase